MLCLKGLAILHMICCDVESFDHSPTNKKINSAQLGLKVKAWFGFD